jgi:2,4-dienoyl-CoA reductase-like NADH-dependent reductase (Old Yellow Enzyme family)
MWKPAERIKYQPSAGTWPTKSETDASRLFSPVDCGPTRLEQRTWIPAMVPWRATEDGFVTPDVLEWYERFAQGRPGAIVVEATGIRDIPSGPLLRIGHDRYIDGLSELVKRVKNASDGHTRIFIQIIDFLSIRRRPDPQRFLRDFLKIDDELRDRLDLRGSGDDDVRDKLISLPIDEAAALLGERDRESMERGARERVTDTRLDHIRILPEVLPDLFASAAIRASAAGFDGVELHYAHAYTMASFLSARNTREDDFGGSRKNRARLPLEVFAKVRASVPDNFAVGCRMLSDDCIEDGNTVEDAAYFATEFARAGMDYISLSRGGKFEDAKQPRVGSAAYPYTGRSGYECMPQYISDEQGPFGRNVGPCSTIRHTIRQAGFSTPVVVAGGMHNFDQAETSLQNDQADIVAFARQALADPDWFEKVRLGRGNEVRLCVYSNYCEGLDQKHKQVTCNLWDRDDLDTPGLSKSRDGKRRMIAPAWNKPTQVEKTPDTSPDTTPNLTPSVTSE